MVTENRLFEYDLIRATSMVFVVAVHSLIVFDFTNTICRILFYLLQTVFFTGNGMFFMLSGKFAVKDQPDYRAYLNRKFQSIGIPILVFFFIRTIYEAPNTLLSPVALVDSYLTNLLGGLGNTEYWFLFVLIGNLIISPMLSNSFNCFDHAESKRFLVFGLLFNLCTMLAAIFSKPFSYNYIFSGWSLYFYLGALSDKLFVTEKEEHALFYGAFFAFIGTTILICMGITEYVHDISPLFTIVTLAFFFGIRKIGGGGACLPGYEREFLSLQSIHFRFI